MDSALGGKAALELISLKNNNNNNNNNTFISQ